MGVYELARAAASRCAARIEELPVFRLAWSERGAPRRGLPVFRLAWSERGAPRRSCAAGGAPGAPGVCMRRRPAGWPRPNAFAPGMVGRQRRPRRGTRARCACPERANAMQGAAVPALPKACSDRPAIRREGFRPDSPGLPGMGGRVVNVNCSAARRWNYLLPPRSSKGRYRSPTGPLVVPVSMKTVRPRCPLGRTRARRPARRVCRAVMAMRCAGACIRGRRCPPPAERVFCVAYACARSKTRFLAKVKTIFWSRPEQTFCDAACVSVR